MAKESPANKRIKMRKRTKSAADSTMFPKQKDGLTSPNFFFREIEDPPRPEAGMPPAKELNEVWNVFVEESWRRQCMPKIMKEL